MLPGISNARLLENTSKHPFILSSHHNTSEFASATWYPNVPSVCFLILAMPLNLRPASRLLVLLGPDQLLQAIPQRLQDAHIPLGLGQGHNVSFLEDTVSLGLGRPAGGLVEKREPLNLL